jgi:hypothetical protein
VAFEVGKGSSGSRGVLTTIKGVVRIPCVGDFAGCKAEVGGMGIRSVGLGGLVRPAFALEDACERVL